MAGDEQKRVSVFRWREGALLEERVGAPPRVVATRGLVVVPVRPSERLRTAVGKLVRAFGGALLVSPLLIVPKLLIPAAYRFASDALTVAFVWLVVAFFAVLNLYFFVSMIWWARRGQSGARFAEARELAGPTVDASTASPGQRVKVTGVVVSLDQAAVVLRRSDVRDLEPLTVVESSAFAVMPEKGAPFVIGRGVVPSFGAEAREVGADDLSEAALALAGADPVLRADRWELRAGERVTVEGEVTHVADNADRVELEGETYALPRSDDEADPYRRGPAGSALVALGVVVVTRT